MKRTRRSVLHSVPAISALAIGASVTGSAAECSGVPEWDPDTAYSGDEQVTDDCEGDDLFDDTPIGSAFYEFLDLSDDFASQ